MKGMLVSRANDMDVRHTFLLQVLKGMESNMEKKQGITPLDFEKKIVLGYPFQKGFCSGIGVGKTEIENGEIYVTGFLQKRKCVGRLEDITSYCQYANQCLVMHEDKILFRFPAYSNDVCRQYYRYLCENYDSCICVKESPALYLSMAVLNLLILICMIGMAFSGERMATVLVTEIVCGFIFLGVSVYGLFSLRHFLVIWDGNVVNRDFFRTKSFKLSEVTNIKMKENPRSRRGAAARSKYVTGYIDDKKCFVIQNALAEHEKCIRDMAKKSGVKVNGRQRKS